MSVIGVNSMCEPAGHCPADEVATVLPPSSRQLGVASRSKRLGTDCASRSCFEFMLVELSIMNSTSALVGCGAGPVGVTSGPPLEAEDAEPEDPVPGSPVAPVSPLVVGPVDPVVMMPLEPEAPVPL